MAATCDSCGIEHLSLGRLLRASDSQLLTRIWDMILFCHEKREWQRSQPCPRCTKDTIGIPFNYGSEQHGLIVCPACYSVAMKKETFKLFQLENTTTQEKRIAKERAEARKLMAANFHRDIQSAKQILDLGVSTASRLMTETPLREIRGTVGIAVATTGLSLFTMLFPYVSMEVFGSASSSAILSAFTHVTFFHLAWNLAFFCALSAPIEREWGTLKHLAVLTIIASFANAIGHLISPFPEAPIVGLSPVIGALLGRHIVLGLPMYLRIPNSKIGFVFEPLTAAMVFAISELRTMIPTSGGMRWFTLTATVVAYAISAAYAEWQRRSLVEKNSPDERRVVTVRSENPMPARAESTGITKKVA